MHSFIRNAAVLSVLVGVAAAGCSSSDDSSSGASGNGGSSGATSNGGKGGSPAGGTAAGGTTNAGRGGASTANGGKSGAGTAGTDDATAGAGESVAGADDGAAGAGGAPSKPPQACNALAFAGESLNLMHFAAASLPTLSNGTLQAGDYRLTSGGIYDGGTGIIQLGSVAHVSIADSTATITQADSYGLSSTLVIVMAQPSTSPPTSVKLSCDTDPQFKNSVGVEASSVLKYGVTGTTFSLYEAPLKLLLVYTLQ